MAGSSSVVAGPSGDNTIEDPETLRRLWRWLTRLETLKSSGVVISDDNESRRKLFDSVQAAFDKKNISWDTYRNKMIPRIADLNKAPARYGEVTENTFTMRFWYAARDLVDSACGRSYERIFRPEQGPSEENAGQSAHPEYSDPLEGFSQDVIDQLQRIQLSASNGELVRPDEFDMIQAESRIGEFGFGQESITLSHLAHLATELGAFHPDDAERLESRFGLYCLLNNHLADPQISFGWDPTAADDPSKNVEFGVPVDRAENEFWLCGADLINYQKMRSWWNLRVQGVEFSDVVRSNKVTDEETQRFLRAGLRPNMDGWHRLLGSMVAANSRSYDKAFWYSARSVLEEFDFSGFDPDFPNPDIMRKVNGEINDSLQQYPQLGPTGENELRELAAIVYEGLFRKSDVVEPDLSSAKNSIENLDFSTSTIQTIASIAMLHNIYFPEHARALESRFGLLCILQSHRIDPWNAFDEVAPENDPATGRFFGISVDEAEEVFQLEGDDLTAYKALRAWWNIKFDRLPPETAIAENKIDNVTDHEALAVGLLPLSAQNWQGHLRSIVQQYADSANLNAEQRAEIWNLIP